MESFKNVQKQLLILRKEVNELKDHHDDGDDDGHGGGGGGDTKERELASQLDQVYQTLMVLSKQTTPTSTSSSPSPSSSSASSGDAKEVWKQKISNAMAEQRSISNTLKDICRRRDSARAEKELQRGINDRRYNLDSVVLDNQYKLSQSGKMGHGICAGGGRGVCISTIVTHHTATNSQNMVAQYIDMGKAAIEEFRRQRGILDAVHNKMVE